MKHLDDRYLIVGLTGRAGAGKDTAADVLCDAYQFYRFAFADPVRAEIVDAFGVDPSIFHISSKERKIEALAIDRCTDRAFATTMAKHGVSFSAARSPREIMRWWGTEYRRAQQSHYWTRIAGDTLHNALRRGFRRIVITDVRFSNEPAFVRYNGGVIWKVNRAMAEQSPTNHQSESEVGQITFDIEVNNNRSMTALAAEVMKAYQASHA
ncbi:hypothetical protein ACMHYO_16360 [Allopusillimonas ginsengisoli]|uniref:hypothetical protein n=1 Tax=Allopusillimonas ginsengisoli TaxID=453575 RepID=UPI0039C10C11